MIRCIAIDDEPLALKQIESYIDKTPFLEKIAVCDSALNALTVLKEEDVDLMFVDINMPDLNGMDFVKTLENPPRIIFTTAYSEYAVEGFKVDALDYLLKPISYSDFLKSANKAKAYFEMTSKKEVKVTEDSNFLFIKSEYKHIRINFDDIKYIESKSEYVRIHLVSSKPIMSLISLKTLEEKLPGNKFMRIHRSYIVNLEKVTIIERNRIVFDGDTYIPIGEQYKNQFQEFLNKNFL
ncbi:LytR/AlgR family response regulator transcription factor [Tenuifilum thalassicum]|uniref:Response regulator transcription factor n=1 Tax=Tenuifilum thalassicum TaxID=2590900 RepID=A0A7D3XEF4_9BACT|nr:LytTR family DNA-binding domain-containing protein [Tenuifilum thalassicum]QKG79867.1 response regulator transcription factor [Tenuifilum thalassicum]